MIPVKSIKLGVIGVGKVAVERHIPSIKSLGDDGVQIFAVSDVAPGLAEKVARRNEIPHAFNDYRELLAMDEINAVSICTPTFTHAQIAIDALKAGKNVYLEKPVTLDESEINEVMEVARQSGKVFLAGSNGMLQGQMLMFKKMLDNKELGEVFTVSINRTSTRSAGDKKRKTLKKDSIILESASHGVEWSMWLLGDPKPVSVTGIGYYKFDNLSIPKEKREKDEVIDSLMALIQFENGSSFIYKLMRSAVVPMVYEINVHGDKGMIKYDANKCYKEKSNDCIWMYSQNSDGVMMETKPLMNTGKTHAAMYEHFFQCIRDGKESFISNGERSVVVMKVLDALRISVANRGKQVFID